MFQNFGEDFKCPDCQKVFTHSSSLHRHRREIHSRAKKFKCRHCLMAFSRKDSLNRHMVVHTGEKFYCQFCEKKYSTKHNLNDHQRKEHWDRVD